MTTTPKPRRRGAPRRRLDPNDPRLAVADFPHGNSKGYARGCSCGPCREAHAEQKYQGKYNRPRPENPRRSVSTARAREHLAQLLKHPGVKGADIARAAGMADTSFLNIFRRESVYSSTSEAFLAVTLDAVLDNQKVVDATQTREHVEHLLEGEDASYAAIAAASGLTYDVIQFIAEGRRTNIVAVTARSILKLTPYIVRRNAAWVSPRRTVTRLRALQAQRFTYQYLAEQLGLKDGGTIAQITGTKGLVAQDTERKVEALYNRLENRQGPSALSAVMARRAGYWPSIHYDEDMNLIRESIPNKHAYAPMVSPQQRARGRLRVMGLTLREMAGSEIAMIVRGADKTIERTRREVGLRLENHRGPLNEKPFIKVGQEDLVKLIIEHTAPIVLSEEVDSFDDPDTDYVALWNSLVAGAQRFRERAAYVDLWLSLLTEQEQSVAA